MPLFWQSKNGPYVHPNRLSDVIALIQVLALDEHTHRSEDGLKGELQGPPRSADTWTAVATEHPEFFRVKPEGTHRTSLIGRHVLDVDATGRRQLPPGFVESLLHAAIEMHDRQLKRAERWTVLIPIWVALLVGIFSLASVLFKYFLGDGR